MNLDKFSITPPIIGHRGASAQAPENTLAAFSRAKALGLQWIEFDVMLAKTGEPVVIHDRELIRTTGQVGRVDETDYQLLKTLDAGSWFSPWFAKQTIPLLRSVLDWLYQEHMAANLEIKPSMLDAATEEKTVKNILAILASDRRYRDIPIIFSSFSIECLSILRRLAPQASLGILLEQWNNDWERCYANLFPVAMHFNQKLLNPERVAEVKAKQYGVLAYTVNDNIRMQELFSWGVDAIFSDCPPSLKNGHKKWI